VLRAQSSPKAPAKVFSSRPSRPGGIRPGLFYGAFAALFGTNVITLVGFLMAPDISGLLSGQNEVVFAAYEDRIAELRIEVDRLHSRQYAQAGDINLQLQELTQQQEVLVEQHQYVRQLAEKAAELGIETAEVSPNVDDEAPIFTSALARPRGDAASEIEAAAAAVQDMMDESRMALASISAGANAATDEIVAELGIIGIRPDLEQAEAVGGPFIPAADGGPDALTIVDEANAVVAALARFKAARLVADAAPVHRPIAGSIRMSSGYGNRKDPFTKGKAFHAGVDFPAPTGTTVLAAGAGKVVFVGNKSGYGNVVEIEHQNGLITRYAHLSAFIAKQGQTVATGTPIARVGSTGRSTGPHLHFEVRRKDAAVDPTKYLAAGKRLTRFLAGSIS
jgi:murein DD-endopeptidase MepM/ murein hydrolase activator NlpD